MDHELISYITAKHRLFWLIYVCMNSKLWNCLVDIPAGFEWVLSGRSWAEFVSTSNHFHISQRLWAWNLCDSFSGLLSRENYLPRLLTIPENFCYFIFWAFCCVLDNVSALINIFLACVGTWKLLGIWLEAWSTTYLCFIFLQV